ncbi:MAG: ABC transporter permease [Bryobacteraceae bacterium]|jgi:predicted permease
MLAKDFAHAARLLRNNPVFTATAVVTIALGIGASTAIFSVANAVLLSPLPYKNPAALVLACSDMTRRGVRNFPFSNADFMDLRNGTKSSFEDIAGVFSGRRTLPREDGTLEQASFAIVTTNFFRLLGRKVVAGRDFENADGIPQNAQPAGAVTGAPQPPTPPNAILSYEYWQRRFGGKRAAIGTRLPLAGQGSLVVGVLEPHTQLLFPPDMNLELAPDIWLANRLAYDAARRNDVSMQVVARLKPGVSVKGAQSQADAVVAESRRNSIIHATSGWTIRIEPMQKNLVDHVRPTILALMGAVIFLLLIACANVANLLLVRASLRERELAVRTAMGATRGRLVLQMFAEALLLASFGAAIGLGLAWVGIRELHAIAPANLPRLDSVNIGWQVVIFAALAGFGAAAIFGLGPAFRASGADVMQILRASGRTAGLGGGLLRSGVVVAEVALSFVLLVGSGLMIRSFMALQRINPGFDPHGLLTFNLTGNRGGNQPQERAAFIRQIAESLRALPGIESVTASSSLPLSAGFSPIRWGTAPALSDPSKFQAVDFQVVLPGYFETMRTPLLEGRTFTDADNAPGRNLVVVDQFLAAKAYPMESAVGKRMLVRLGKPEPEWVEIIGVVAHQRATSLADPGREQLYLTDGYITFGVVRQWALRTAADPGRYARAARQAVAKIDPHLLFTEVYPMQHYMLESQASTRFSLLLIGVFAAIAALLAAVGLYGVLATLVRQRRAEIGVRVALGAAPASIFSLVVGHGFRLAVMGIAAGLAAALFLTRALASLLVGVTPTDPVTFAAMIAVFLLIATLASWIPARRAAGMDPSVALRGE